MPGRCGVSEAIRVAVVGLGKIAHDQHLPAIAANPGFELVATVSLRPKNVAGRPCFASLDDLAASGIAIDAVVLSTPPQVRRALALAAIARGWHTFLEKPPCATLAEAVAVRDAAAQAGVGVLASWHARCASGVEPARKWLSGRRIRRASIVWREDVRVWHPGQSWLWEPGGLGVFDPGINALSIATRILPSPLFVEEAVLEEPSNRAAPIAARVGLRDISGAPIAMDLDFRHPGPPSWDIVAETEAGTLTLSQGGEKLSVTGGEPPPAADLGGEYPALYARFAAIIRDRASDVDLSPLRLVADTFLRARRVTVEPFVE